MSSLSSFFWDWNPPPSLTSVSGVLGLQGCATKPGVYYVLKIQNKAGEMAQWFKYCARMRTRVQTPRTHINARWSCWPAGNPIPKQVDTLEDPRSKLVYQSTTGQLWVQLKTLTYWIRQRGTKEDTPCQPVVSTHTQTHTSHGTLSLWHTHTYRRTNQIQLGTKCA